MRTIVALLILSLMSIYSYAQTDTLSNKKDTTRIVVGKKEIKIVETEDGTDIKVRKKNSDSEKKDKDTAEVKKEYKYREHSWNHHHHRHNHGFTGHWSGIQVGLNNYLNADYSMSLSENDEFMSLNTDRSINFNLNFFQHSIRLIGKNFGLVTGMGLEFNNYFFEHNNSIIKNTSGVIISKSYDSLHLDKSKLVVTYLTVPLIFEWQFPASVSRSNRLRIAAGVIGGLKLGSHTKVVYREEDKMQKNKNHDDFNINFLRYGFTGRVGYNKVDLYFNYYPVSLFEKNKGPELYPISVGLSFAVM